MTDGVYETSTRIAKLEREIAELRRKLTRVFTVLDISTVKEPFLRLMISLDATEAQESDVYDLMGEVELGSRRARRGWTTSSSATASTRSSRVMNRSTSPRQS